MTAHREDAGAKLGGSVAELEQRLRAIAAERDEALEQQKASADILNVISNSVADAQPVFDKILSSVGHLFGGEERFIFLVGEDGLLHIGAGHGPRLKQARALFPTPLEGTASEVAFRERRIINSADVFNDPDIPLIARERYRGLGSNYSMAVAPMLWEDRAIGSILVARTSMVPFSEKECTLLRSFADQAVIAIQNARMFNETREALERQTATAEILKVIASSPSDVQPVFNAIAERSKRLVDALSTTVFRLEDGMMHLRAFTPTGPEADASLKAMFPAALSNFSWSEAIGSGEIYRVVDTDLEIESLRELARLRGFRSMLFVPLLSDRTPIGLIAVTRVEPGPFFEHHVQLLQTFADQAVIAIENVRLFDEVQARTDDLSESLQQQTATSEVLKVISRSTFDLQTVLDTLVESAATLCGADMAALNRPTGDAWSVTATYGFGSDAIELLKNIPVSQGQGSISGRVVTQRKMVHIGDVEDDPEYLFNGPQKLSGYRTLLGIPLMRDAIPIGVLVLGRTHVQPFTDKQIELVTTFADQAVIAIENARLFDEVQARTEDLSESLQQQTAVGDVLKTISRSTFDLQPVLDTLVETAARLCDTEMAFILRREGDMYRAGAAVGFSREYIEFLKQHPISADRGTITGRVALERHTVQILDVAADPEYTMSESISLAGQRTALGVPLLRENELIGVIVLARQRVDPFSPKQIELVTTFADQAVIAIENVRLFDEVRQRTDDLSESLQQQTATAEVLKVISRSTFDLKAVLATLVQSARELCNAPQGMVLLRDGEVYRTKMQLGYPPDFERYILDNPIHPNPHSGAGRAAFTGQVVHFPDVLADPEYRLSEGQRLGGYRTMLSVPLLREKEVIGVFSLGRTEPDPFTDRQIELVQTFADQAVIAIENVRLFDEVQARTRDLTEALTYQTGSSNILKVIASSPTNVDPVLKAIADSACELCEAHDALVHLREGDSLRYRAHHGPIPFGFEKLPSGDRPIPFGAEKLPINRNWVTGRSVVDKVPVHLHDVLSAEGDEFPEAQRLSRREGTRTILSVPLLRDNESIGAIVLRRTEVNPFSEKQIVLLQTFADQAVIAIGNVHLFEEVQQRTKELSQSLENLRTAQDRLVQTEKLASLGQLTAGIAHEIKNPLNFVNNFAALSAELTDELNDVLRPAALADKMREEIDELTGMLKSNLEKVVQHGKRADSIVKNMLLHSREGSGDHRPADINALLDESLNLAYHGARAEKPGFNVTLQRDFDDSAGMVELFPQEITRAFLNLISNGFYATAKRKTESEPSGFEPMLRATTKNIGNGVEIRIRDNGTGIPAEVKEKMFNPFFTTKPAGEGTGLGLSMSHDIIVKQHGGTIDVDTQAGQFTEFKIFLPRTSSVQNKKQGQA